MAVHGIRYVPYLHVWSDVPVKNILNLFKPKSKRANFRALFNLQLLKGPESGYLWNQYLKWGNAIVNEIPQGFWYRSQLYWIILDYNKIVFYLSRFKLFNLGKFFLSPFFKLTYSHLVVSLMLCFNFVAFHQTFGVLRCLWQKKYLFQ